MICPQCQKLIGVGEARCPYCGAWRPGLYGFTPALQGLFGNRLDLIALISATCVTLYVVSLVLDLSAVFQWRGIFDILSPGTRPLYQLGMTSRRALDLGWWWTLLTAIYLHGSLLHIFFNVMWIRQLGPAVSDIYGPARGFVIFSVAGVAGFVVSNFASGNPTIGASGSIFGLLAALIVYGRRVGHTMLTNQMWQWALIMFVFGFMTPSVNNWAHAGGFAGGWVIAEGMRMADRREGRGVQLLALSLLAGTGVGFVLSFIAVTRALLSG